MNLYPLKIVRFVHYTGSPTCPPDLTPVNCVVDPCMFATCPAHPGATCIADYCGACNARFFDATGNEVTDSCGEYNRSIANARLVHVGNSFYADVEI